MKIRLVVAAAFATLVFAGMSAAQLVVVNDPTKEAVDTKLTAVEQRILDNQAVPAASKMISKETCEPDINIAGVAHGAFSRAGSSQSLMFYQYCQNWNGFGYAGLVLIENGTMMGNFMADAGWTVGIGRVPDVNANGLDEFTLTYSGGLHQGHGGTGVDLMEFAGGMPKGLGWYKAEEFGETEATTVWKLTAKPGPTPVFYQQKYFSGENKPYRRVGTATVVKLGKVISKFEVVK